MFSTGCRSTYDEKPYDVIGNEKDIEELFHCIKANFMSNFELISELEEENKELKSEHYKDKEIAELKKRIDELREELIYGFGITKEQHEDIRAWQKKHEEEMHPELKNTKMGVPIHYEFYPTSIGSFGKCICEICQKNSLVEESPKDYMKKHNGFFEFDDV